MRVAGDALPVYLPAESGELRRREAAFEVAQGVDARGVVTLDIDVVAGRSVVFATEEPVVAHVKERRRRRERGQMAADAFGCLVGAHDHDRGVPADVGADAAFYGLVAREEGLSLRWNGVEVGGGDRGGYADVQTLSAL